MNIAFVRHPPPKIEAGICYGRLDIPLHPAALAEIGTLTTDPRLRGTVRVWTSPAARCRILAEAIAGELAVAATADLRLQELDFGAWEGRSWTDIGRADLDRWAESPLNFAAPGGETGVALIARVQDFHADLIAEGRDCVVISHGGPLKILLALARGEPVDLLAPPPALGSITLLQVPAAARFPVRSG
jgi:alpha-ribazole phosphatase